MNERESPSDKPVASKLTHYQSATGSSPMFWAPFDSTDRDTTGRPVTFQTDALLVISVLMQFRNTTDVVGGWFRSYPLKWAPETLVNSPTAVGDDSDPSYYPSVRGWI